MHHLGTRLMQVTSVTVARRALLAFGRGISRLVDRMGPEGRQVLLRPLVEPLVANTRELGIKVENSWRHTVQTAIDSEGASIIAAALMALRPTQRPWPSRGILHLSSQVELRLAQLRSLKHFASTEDPVEAVHQLRVASRRLRAFVDLFEPFLDSTLAKSAKSRLRRVTRAVQDLRDADVQITRLREQLTRTVDESERAALYHLLDWANKRRKKLARRAEQTLSGQDFDALAPPLREMLDAVALRAQAPSMTYSLLAELAFRPVSEAARSMAPSSAATPEAECWHDLRLALKRLRYAAELLEPELGPTYEDHHQRAKKLQQLLGDLQDGVVFERIVRKRKSKARRRNDRELVQGLQALLDRATQQHLQLVERCREHCAQPAGLFDTASS